MKIELGCGESKHQGYLGIDLSEHADLKHDLRLPLPFENESVDEILVVHVIESFYGWQFYGILKDWYRVLKSGGFITIEFTDLEQTCKMYLGMYGDEHRAHGKWGIHGDQSRPLDPIVLHNYVYTKDELESLLHKVGFTNIWYSNQVEHKEIRDLRLTATKP